MSYKLIGKHYLLLGLLLSLTSVLGAVKEYCPLPEPVTEESYTWNFPNEASQTLADFEKEARLIRTHVTVLQTFARVPALISPEAHAYELMRVRERVNRLGNRLCRLMEIERVTEPWQQGSIERVRESMTELADRTEAAIAYLNDNHSPVGLASKRYSGYLDGMYQSADLLCHCVMESQPLPATTELRTRR